MAGSHAASHQETAEEFARRASNRFGDAIAALLLFGSAARGEARGANSDLDLLVVLADGVDEAGLEDELRELAYDIELERAVVLSLIVLSHAEFERRAEQPFFRHVREEAQSLHG